ncbi:GbsR/MarR family transcriptional regulator [Microlunatus soli]|uniref:MarR family protein n=1 Tax=Microlunatus soli TaxID=630515 RepID=A0A1H1YTJ3_9ACTN|nr:helix-turn-helix domain-containing protein [Microlunatus soli]SDT24835.1 MarR family protein [Microlunatus soli]
MPGGRLTLHDRQQIASWLRRGVGRAEIARRLGRPRSTINRELERNGGPDGYRAAAAQQATRRRARRTGTGGSAARRPEAAAYGRDPAAVGDFTEEFTALMIRTGLPPMSAKVFGCLFTSDDGAFTAAELTERLRVSPASISKAVGYLEQLELITRDRHSGTRRERYVIEDDAWYRTWLASTRSIMLWATAADEGTAILGASTPAGARLRRTSDFFRLLAEDMTNAAEQRRELLQRSTPDP